MAKPKAIVPDPPPEIHIVGITKIGPAKYAVVTGTTANPIVDSVAQPLEFAAATAKLAFARLMDVLP